MCTLKNKLCRVYTNYINVNYVFRPAYSLVGYLAQGREL